MSGGSGGKGGNTPACAACKFQRRKCCKHCPLAPYFPASKTDDFENVHRVFGVSNITRNILKFRTQAQRDDYMHSIVIEAHIRKISPVHGCTALIIELFRQLELTNQELQRVLIQTQACKDRLNNLTTHDDVTTDFAQIEIGSPQPGSGSGQDLNFGPETRAQLLSRAGRLVSPAEMGGRSGQFVTFGASSSNDVTTAFFKPECDKDVWDENEAYDHLRKLGYFSDETDKF